MNDHLVARAAVGGGRAAAPAPCPRRPERAVLDLLDDDANGFDFALRELRAELAPATVLERLLVDQIVLSAGRLRASTEAERQGRPASEWAPLAEVAQSSLTAAIDRLTRGREFRPNDTPWAAGWRVEHRNDEITARASHVESFDEPLPDDEEDVSWTDREETLSFAMTDAVSEPTPEPTESAWRSRLEFDDLCDEDWPIVRGTRIDAGRIVNLVIDGCTWRDILRQHPELSENDIRACLNYAVEQDGPFEPTARP